VSAVEKPSRLRRVGAVLAGFFAVAVLPIGLRMSDGLFVLATAYRVLYTILGGYLTSRLAPDQPMRHALVLGFVGTAVAIVGAAATWTTVPALGPRWYPLALVVTALPCCWLGGLLFLSRKGSRPASEEAVRN
jgi:surface polysaccharide O-acyltransferase-like enzyme